jgi:hypothetical protein
MFPKKLSALLALQAGIIFFSLNNSPAQDKPSVIAPDTGLPASASVADKTAPKFDDLADKALQAMQLRAGELKIQGVAVVAFSEGDTVKSWTSKMLVVGHLTTGPSKNDPNGANLLGIAYAKASEMAETLKNSGTSGQPPMRGEFGWQGGVVAKGKTGTIIVAFSGGPSEGDVKISQAGMAVLSGAL